MEPTTRAWLEQRVDPRVTVAVGVAWLVLVPIALTLEPSADEAPSSVGDLIGTAMFVALVGTLAGLATQRRWGLAASLGTAVLFTVGSILCPVSGHHGFGAWWYGQMLCCVALIAASVVALPRGVLPSEREGTPRAHSVKPSP